MAIENARGCSSRTTARSWSVAKRHADAVALYDAALARDRTTRACRRRGRAPPAWARPGARHRQAGRRPRAGRLRRHLRQRAPEPVRPGLSAPGPAPGSQARRRLAAGRRPAGPGRRPCGAREAYAKVPATSSRYVAAQSKLAWSYQTAGDKERAVVLAQQSAAAAPKSRDAQVTYADLLRANERWAESAAALDPLIAGEGDKPDSAPAVHARHRPGAGWALGRRRARPADGRSSSAPTSPTC